MHTCSACGTENRAGRRFCAQCGAALSVNCSNCGGVNQPTDRFCGDCGAALDAVAVSTAPDGGRIQTAAVGRRAAAGVGAVRGPGRLHDAERASRSRGGPRAAVALLRPLPIADRALRRHGREVHRRRGDGGLGHAGRARGRRRTRGQGRAGADERGGAAGRGGRNARAARPRGGADRQRGRGRRRRGRGDGAR